MRLPLPALILAAALPAFAGCGDSSEPAPAPTPAEAPPEPTPEPEATPDPGAEQTRPAFSVVLDPAASTLEWTSIKNGDAPVKGKLTKLGGGLALTAADLTATTGTLTVDLSGVDSAEPVRDSRIAETFFGVAPDAARSATVSLASLTAENPTLEPGAETTGSATFTVGLDGTDVSVEAPVRIARKDADVWTVATSETVSLSIADLGLSAGLTALIELCGHESVEDEVAVAASLTFKAAE